MPKPKKKSKARPDEPLTPKGSDSRTGPWPFLCPDCGGKRSRQAKRCIACAREAGAQHGGVTAEERSQHPLRGAKKQSNGQPCRAWAGAGTPHSGVGLCAKHGGNTPNHKKHAADIEARRRMVKLGLPLDDLRPGEALMGLLRATAGHVQWLRAELEVVEDLSSPQAAVLLDLYDAERDRLTRVSEACIRAGATEAMVLLERQRASQLLDLVQRAASTAGMSSDQRRLLGVALRREVAAMRLAQGTGSEDAVEDAERQLKRVLAEAEPEPLTVPAEWPDRTNSP